MGKLLLYLLRSCQVRSCQVSNNGIYNVPKAGGKSKNVVVIKSIGDPKAGHDYVDYEAGDLKIQNNAPAFNQYGAPKISNTDKVKAIVGN